jgi:hypothetical protein
VRQVEPGRPRVVGRRLYTEKYFACGWCATIAEADRPAVDAPLHGTRMQLHLDEVGSALDLDDVAGDAIYPA